MMQHTSGSVVNLTEAQRQIVEQSWDARILVTAGAGAGKTTTLTYRLEHLVGSEDLQASEILVLSFSRAAVRDLRDRVDHLAKAAKQVRAQTFDAWALSLLRQARPDQELSGTSFDDRIEMAVDAIRSGVIEASEYGPPAHVIIDEVQDLVGVRRELVQTLLGRFEDQCGFTAVGDAAQSIYGFQINDLEQRAAETNRFFSWVRATFAEDLAEFRLDENFRARTADARTALPFGEKLSMLPIDHETSCTTAAGIYEELSAELAAMPDFGKLDTAFVLDSLRFAEGTTAFLCRDNGQVLALSEELRTHDVPHRIQRKPHSRPAPTWLLDVVQTAGGARTLTEERFTQVAMSDPTIDDPARIWRALRRVASSPRNQLDVESLRQAIADRRIPDELSGNEPCALVLSTIHRAKGLEFDQVVITEPKALDLGSPTADAPNEARLLYVAMTRARDSMYRLEAPNTRFIRNARKTYSHVDRWYRGGWKKWQRFGIEAGEDDVSRDAPAGVVELVTDPVVAQTYLRRAVAAGDEVELLRLHELPGESGQAPPYGIVHQGHPIGVVSERFLNDLGKLLKPNAEFEVRSFPLRIVGLRIDCVEAVAGHTAITARSGLGDHGVWLAPRLCGLGQFEWGAQDSTDQDGTIA
ncbi:UvrD-helicase domain-containing protein [Nocardia sp. NPDC055321]